MLLLFRVIIASKTRVLHLPLHWSSASRGTFVLFCGIDVFLGCLLVVCTARLTLYVFIIWFDDRPGRQNPYLAINGLQTRNSQPVSPWMQRHHGPHQSRRITTLISIDINVLISTWYQPDINLISTWYQPDIKQNATTPFATVPLFSLDIVLSAN